MAQLVYSVSPADLPAPTSLQDVDRELFREQDIRRERNLARMRPSRQGHEKQHEAYVAELEAKLSR